MHTEEPVDTSEITVRDLSRFVKRQDTKKECLVVCDQSQVSKLAEVVSRDAERQDIEAKNRRCEDFRARYPKADEEIVKAFVDKIPQPYGTLEQVPMNLLTFDEIELLCIRKRARSEYDLLADDGGTVVPLYWAIVAPHAGLADAVNPTTNQQLRLLKQIVGIRNNKERDRLAVIWKQWGLPPFKPRAKTQDIRECLCRIGSLIW